MGDRIGAVSQGGLFHVHKVKYSPETEAFLRGMFYYLFKCLGFKIQTSI